MSELRNIQDKLDKLNEEYYNYDYGDAEGMVHAVAELIQQYKNTGEQTLMTKIVIGDLERLIMRHKEAMHPLRGDNNV